MTDITPTSGQIRGKGIKRSALVQKRFASERRFKYLGMAAVLVACSFLVILLATVVRQALPAFTYNYVTLEIDLASKKVKADNLRKTNFRGLANDALAKQFPFVKGRKTKKQMRNLLSAAINQQLRSVVLADPSMVGEVQSISLPVSDEADLYLKGLTTNMTLVGQPVASTISDTGDGLEVKTDGDGFKTILAEVRVQLDAERLALSRRLETRKQSYDFQNSILDDLKQRLVDAEDDKKEGLEDRVSKQSAILEALQAELNKRGAALKSIEDTLAAGDASIKLTQDFASYFAKTSTGTIKVSSISPDTLTGEAIIPLADTEISANQMVQVATISTPESNRKFNDLQAVLVESWKSENLTESGWNTTFFTGGASREPEQAGIWGAVVGSFFTMIVTLAIAFPIGVGAALYLEEFAPKNRVTDFIEVNINNLAAVPSIVFGLLGLAVFLNLFGFQRSIPVVGGLVLALMTLPTIIIASRAALKAVPPSIREAAMGVGASRIQTVFHHVLPLAMPGILTGTIIGMAQALGETAPLLMIGMVAFIVDIPASAFDPATVLPVQIYMWADFPETAFQQKTSAAILVLLGFLVIMNALAVILRKRFERRW